MLFPLYDSNPHQRLPWVTMTLIVVNAGVFWWQQSLPQERAEDVVAHYGFVPARLSQLANPNKVVEVQFPRQIVRGRRGAAMVVNAPPRVVKLPGDRGAVLLSLFTMMFLHGSWFHLISNMWFLWLFGNNIEDRLGPVVFVLFYLLGGIVATFCHWSLASGKDAITPCVGASGAVSAVLGAYAITFPFASVRTVVFLGIFFTLVDLPALVVLGVWFIGQLLEARNMLQVGAQQGAGVAFWAHVGGFVAGWALMPFLSPSADERADEMKRQLDDFFQQDDPADWRRDG